MNLKQLVIISLSISPLLISNQVFAVAPFSSTSDSEVAFNDRLAVSPLELPIGPESNVLIVHDDSGSMLWDVMTAEDGSWFRLPSGGIIVWVNKASTTVTDFLAASEQRAPGQGLWKLRNPDFNNVYYNPEVQYRPWKGLHEGVEFPDSLPTAARHDPLSATPTTNLTLETNYEGVAAFLDDSGRYRTLLVTSENYYIPRYYKWQDKNDDGNVDSAPSPVTDQDNSEGELIEIRPGSTYPRGVDRSDCATSTKSCTYDEELQNFANWFTYYRTREYVAKAALGIVVANSDNLRIGYAKLNSEENILPVETMNASVRTGTKAALLNAIYSTNSSGGTPLRRSLRDAGRYFECVANDIFGSTGITQPGDAACPVLASPAGNCQKNFTLLISDGSWNGSSPQTGDSDGDDSSNFDGGAFAHVSPSTLADVAMLYYERDLHTSLPNEVPTTARDRSLASVTAFEDSGNEIMHQHMTTFTVGFGVSGLVKEDPIDFTQAFDWGNPFRSTAVKIDDLRHAAYNARGSYLDASSGADLAEQLASAFTEFSQGSGAASAVSFNSQEILEDTLIFRAFYNTKINTGDLVAQTFGGTGIIEKPVWSSAEELDKVTATDREIITLDPGIDTSRTYGGIPFRGTSLSASQREVFISDEEASEEQKNIEVNQKVDYLRGDSSLERPVGKFRERPVLKGRLGDIVHSTPVFIGAPDRIGRDRSPYPQSHLYSEFSSTNATRKKMLYVSANDGMLHGFDAVNGSEVFGYVPNNLLLGAYSEKITELLDFEYSHKFLVDLTPALNDVYIDADGDGDKEWITLLMGGQGAGGKAFFALNVTDPTKLTEATASDVVLWEFSEEDDAYPTDEKGKPLVSDRTQRLDLREIPKPIKDMGYSFSVPTLAMSNAIDRNGDQEWVAIFGNGYNSTSGIGKLFILFLDRGVDGVWCHPDKKHNVVLNVTPLPTGCTDDQHDFIKIDTTIGVKNGLPNGLGTPRAIDIDGNGTVDYAYAGDRFGNFFRFDLTSSDFNNWSYERIFKAEYVNFSLEAIDQPITTQPIVTRHPTEDDGFIVIFSTGSYITIPDGASKGIQSIYGLWDRMSPGLININELVQQRYTNVDDDTFGNVRRLSNNLVDYTSEGGKRGWFNHLDSVAAGDTQGTDDPEFPGERALRNIQIRGGRAFVNSIIPRSDTSCVDIAGGFALAFCPATGAVNCLVDGVFDLNNDGYFDVADGASNSIIAGIRFEDAVPTDSTFIGSKRVTQLSDQSLDMMGTNTNFGKYVGRLSWKQLNSPE